MRIAILTTDSREHYAEYEKALPYFGSAPEALLQGLSELENIEVHVLSCVRQPIKSPAKIYGNVWYHSLLVPKLGWLRTGYQGCIRAVRSKLKEIQPHIVHGQGTERDCALSAVFSGFPNVITIHGNMAPLAKMFDAPIWSYHGLAALLEDLTLPRTAGVFCNSAYTETLVRPRAKRVWHVPNPIRSMFFEPGVQTSRPVCPELLNIGVISKRKRQVEILDFAAVLNKRGHRFRISFVGSVSEADPYAKEFLEKLTVAEKAGYGRHLGMKSTLELIQLCDQSDAMLHFPSEESFGLVAAEALARNMKFFGADVGGLTEIANGCDLAEVHPPDDWEALSGAVINWLEQGSPKPQNARAEIARRYHPDVIAKRHLEIYREVLSAQ